MTISPERMPGTPARHHGEEWVYVVSGTLGLDYDGEAHSGCRRELCAFRRRAPHRLGAEDVARGPCGCGTRTERPLERSPMKNTLQQPRDNGAPGMTTTTSAQIEGTGENYDLEPVARHAAADPARGPQDRGRHQCRHGRGRCSSHGQGRAQVHGYAPRLAPHHRLGPNTTKDFMARSEPGVVLQPNDIFFIDIGPIYEDCEGDAGDTFVFGDDPEHHKAKVDVRTIWEDVRAMWFAEGSPDRSSTSLRSKRRASAGWKLNIDLSGHRLSDFPHSAHYDGSLADVSFRPNPNLWVLEIAIAHPDMASGAFYGRSAPRRPVVSGLGVQR